MRSMRQPYSGGWRPPLRADLESARKERSPGGSEDDDQTTYCTTIEKQTGERTERVGGPNRRRGRETERRGCVIGDAVAKGECVSSRVLVWC